MGQQISKKCSQFLGLNLGPSKKQCQMILNEMKQKDLKIIQLQQYAKIIKKESHQSLQKKQKYFAQILQQKINMTNSELQQLNKIHFEEKNKIQNDYNSRILQISNKLTEILKQKQQLEVQKQEIVYQTDPQLQKQLQQIRIKNKEQLLELKKLNDPEKLKQAQEKQFKNYLQYLSRKNWPKKQYNQKQKHHAIVGDISSGKSTSLNYFFELNEETGVDETTTEAKIVFKHDNICVWDTPGICQEFDIMNFKNLQLFAYASKVFLLFDKSLKCCKECLQVMAAVRKKKNLYVIRTMCDKFNSEEEFKNALNTDKQLLLKWNLGDVPIYTISACKDITFEDNLVVKGLFST